MTVELIGVPTNSSGTTDGVARAPAALREAGLVEACRATGAALVDGGDVTVDPPDPRRGPEGVIDATGLTATLGRVRRRVAVARRAGRIPVLIGGDCPIVLGALAGVAEPDGTAPGLLFIDGHEDAWPPTRSTTGEAADMELGWLLGRGRDGLPPPLLAEIPTLAPGAVAILGARDRREILEAGVDPLDDLVPVVDDRAVVADPAAAARSALDRIGAPARPWWLHVDLDVLSSAALPAVDYEQPGGLGWADLAALTSAALAIGGAIGATVTIYNPDLDPGRRSAPAIVEAIAGIVARLAGRTV
jgi:arginase